MHRQNFLALDVGEKRIGLAVADSDVKIAVPFGYIEQDEQTLVKITEIILNQGVSVLIVGYPRNQSGESTKQTEFVEEFAGKLAQIEVDAELVFQDESLTSVEAERRLGQVKDKGLIDAEAASIILQDYLEENYGY